jgi:hypothetical protein
MSFMARPSIVVAGAAKQSGAAFEAHWIAASLRSSQ